MTQLLAAEIEALVAEYEEHGDDIVSSIEIRRTQPRVPDDNYDFSVRVSVRPKRKRP